MRAITFAFSVSVAAACVNSSDCSLNGQCVQNVCSCRPGWVNTACAALDLAPVDPYAGRNGLAEGSSSWGGGVLEDDGGTYHLYYSKMVDGCTLAQWQTNSACWHATSASASGPFTDSDQVLDAFCHNAVPARAPDGTWLLFHIGCGGGAPPKNCSAGGAHEEGHETAEASCVGGGLAPRVLSAPAPGGPWTPLNGGDPILNGTANAWDNSITNVAPWIEPDGSVLLAFRGKDTARHELLGVAQAPSWRGPYEKTLPGPIISASGEDPVPFRDSDGFYHILFHDFSGFNGGHAFATSWGGPWTYASAPAYNLSITWVNGTTDVLSRRERPQLFFEGGQPAYLYNGVVARADASTSASFTTAAKVRI
jgi:hypothetical protein